jgi:hypothetical protein
MYSSAPSQPPPQSQPQPQPQPPAAVTVAVESPALQALRAELSAVDAKIAATTRNLANTKVPNFVKRFNDELTALTAQRNNKLQQMAALQAAPPS